MSGLLSEIINRFSGLRVLVIGEAILDTYISGEAERISREAPVPIIAVSQRSDSAGGAANAAANVSALGASVTLLSVIGADHEGGLLRQRVLDSSIDDSHVYANAQRRTLNKARVLAGSQLIARFDQGSNEEISSELEARLIADLRDLYEASDAVIVSDYGCGLMTPSLIAAVSELQAQTPRLLAVDALDLRPYRDSGITAVKPNYEEALNLIGMRPVKAAKERLLQIATAGDQLLEATGSLIAAVTLDREGGIVFERGAAPYRTYARPTPNSRAAGAGDTFIAALALSLAAGAHTPAAAELAGAAASIVVSKEGTSCCTSAELRAHVDLGDKFQAIEGVQARAATLRAQGLRVAFTNGCFDILHRGHITYLNRAKALADVLIVGLNSDASVRRLKGEGRPINALEDRAQVLAALSCVDYVVPFAEDTAEALIRALEPDLYVKGGDYTRETLSEADLVEELGGSLQILPYLDDSSTSAIIERIRQAEAAPGI